MEPAGEHAADGRNGTTGSTRAQQGWAGSKICPGDIKISAVNTASNQPATEQSIVAGPVDDVDATADTTITATTMLRCALDAKQLIRKMFRHELKREMQNVPP